ncbi:MAG TPA: trypsin-like peptidase domain-containing protein [Burkholderiales bacterium]|nr:trypsin-like peptidase domain-containing protein [Burkholderiales bacterium]
MNNRLSVLAWRLGLAALLSGCAQLAPATAASDGCRQSTAELYETASPAVVMISAKSINPFSLRDRVERAIGSGFVIDASSGLIVTNAHVAFNRQTIAVVLDDSRVVPARLVGADPIFDIAVIQIPVSKSGKLSALKLGDSDELRIGEDVIAIGNPMGLEQTVTSGIVSGLNRVLPETPLSVTEPMIQTDTPINPGNSGGPLLNRCGDVVGMNTAILPEAQNIGFAIPSNLIKSVLPPLVKHGRLIRPWVGFHGTLIGTDLVKLLKLPLTEGLLVEVVEPGGPAAAAGLHGGEVEFAIGGTELLLGGDIVTQINGTATSDEDALETVMRSLRVGDRLKLKVFREGKLLDFEYPLPERPFLPGDLHGEGPGPDSVLPQSRHH